MDTSARLLRLFSKTTRKDYEALRLRKQLKNKQSLDKLILQGGDFQQIKDILDKDSRQQIKYYHKEIRGLTKAARQDRADVESRLMEIVIDQEKKQEEQEKQEEQPPETKEQVDGMQVPANLEVQTLSLEGVDSECMVLGVQKHNEEHAHFLQDVLANLTFDAVVTQISPDLPMFMRTTKPLEESWVKLLAGLKESQFLVSTNPFYLQDITLDRTKIAFFMEQTVRNNPQLLESGPMFMYSRRPGTQRMECNCLLQPLLEGYNNSRTRNVLLGEAPLLKYLDYVARTVDKSVLKELFKQKIEQHFADNLYFDPLLLRKDLLLQPRSEYLTEVVRQSLLTYSRVLVLVESDGHASEVASLWPKVSSSASASRRLHSFLTPSSSEPLAFVDYLEKLFLVDSLTHCFLNDYFVRFNSFPFLGEDTLQADMYQSYSFLIWNHFRQQYLGRLERGQTDLSGIEAQSLGI